LSKVTVTINGNKITADSDKTILEVIEENKIDHIPTLCHDPKLPPYGSCYICVVEIQGMNRLIPSCCSPVSEGMVIHTNNERIRNARKTALELLLSNHYADCIAPCKLKCPAGVDVQGYIALTAQGKYREAVELIKKTNPLPLVCGRVCVRECEIACRRNRVDEPVGIDYLKRYSSDIDLQDMWTPEVPEKNGKKVAIVGGGPSGLSCAYFLMLEGYGVTILDRLPELGGMLKWGIPEYRLPRKILDREIKWITDLGAEVKTNVELGKDFSIDSLFSEGYSAIYLAMGAQEANKMHVPGEEKTKGILPGIDFLLNVELNRQDKLYGTVVIVGGGNTAIDAARTSLRHGSEKVIILYRRTRQEMPANNMEIEAAIHEGIEIRYLAAPVKILEEKGRLKALECIKMELGEPDKSGRRRPVPMEGSEYTLECDFAISAIGQAVALGKELLSDKRLNKTRWNTIDAGMDTFETSIPGVFSGGDVVTGPAVAIDAIAHGKKAAHSIDEYLRTGKVTPVSKEFVCSKDIHGEIPESDFSEYEKIKREVMPELLPEERIKNFQEVELGYGPGQAEKETSRCLECGCSYVFDCKLKEYATDYGIDLSKYMGEFRKYRVDRAHPFITLDPNKCIACGRCVRTCSEILKVSALGFVYRGFKSVVKPAMEKKLLETNCISCGNCIGACPTGAITETLPFKKPGPWYGEKVNSICNFCSVGCNLKFNVVNEDIYYVTHGDNHTHNKGYLCIKGKFGYRYLLDKERLAGPKIKKDGELKDTDWDEALQVAGKRIKEIKDKYGSDSIALFGSPKMTNEELYIIQKFGRSVLKTNNIHSLSNILNGTELNALDESWGITASTATMDDIGKSDVIMVINSDLSAENLIMELKIKDAIKNGAKLVIVNSTEMKLTKYSDLWIDARKGTGTILLKGIMNELIKKNNTDSEFIKKHTENYEKFKESIAGITLDDVCKKTGVERDKINRLIDLTGNKDLNLTVIYNIDYHGEKSRNDLKAIGNLLMLTGKIGKEGNGLIILRDFANSQGLLDMGVIPDYLPGYIKDTEKIENLSKIWKDGELKEVFKPVNLSEKLLNGEIKAVLIFGENPLLDGENLKYFTGCEFIMVIDNFLTTTAREAEVVLPASTYIESGGSFTACDGRVQKFRKIFPPKSGMENLDIIKNLSQKLGGEMKYSSVEEIFEELKEVLPLYKDIEDGKFRGSDMFKGKFPAGKGKFTVYDTDTSTMKPEKFLYLSSENYFDVNIKRKIVIGL